MHRLTFDAIERPGAFLMPLALLRFQTARITLGQWFLTAEICYEFLRVATHHRVFSAPLKATQALGANRCELTRVDVTV